MKDKKILIIIAFIVVAVFTTVKLTKKKNTSTQQPTISQNQVIQDDNYVDNSYSQGNYNGPSSYKYHDLPSASTTTENKNSIFNNINFEQQTSNTIKLPTQTLYEQQMDRTNQTLVKKAIANYEVIVTLYMAENSKTNLNGIFGSNCQNAGTYFHIASQNGCSFDTSDSIHWEFNPNNGQATVTCGSKNTQYSIQMGMCSDGSLNCQAEFPDAYALRESH